KPGELHLLFVEERHDPIVQEIGCRDWRFWILGVWEWQLRIGVNKGLWVDAANPFHVADVERVLGAAVARAFALELTVRLLVGLGFLQGDDLRLGEDQPFLRDFCLQRLEALLHRLEIMTLPDAAHPGRRDRVAKFPHFVGDADLAEGRLLQRKFNDPRLDLGRGPVRQDRLLTADLLQRQLAAFVIEFLEAVEAVAAIAEHLAGLAHIAELPGELQQAHLSFDNLLVLGHRRCPHKTPRPGSPQPWPAPRPASALASALWHPKSDRILTFYNKHHRGAPPPPAAWGA